MLRVKLKFPVSVEGQLRSEARCRASLHNKRDIDYNNSKKNTNFNCQLFSMSEYYTNLFELTTPIHNKLVPKREKMVS